MIHEDWSRLRQLFANEDSFLTSWQTQKIRSMEREIPEWAFDDSKIVNVLLRSFPKMTKGLSQNHTAFVGLALGDLRQTEKAARWFSIINLYYRMGLPRQTVREVMGISEANLNNFIQRISFAFQGLNTVGKTRVDSKFGVSWCVEEAVLTKLYGLVRSRVVDKKFFAIPRVPTIEEEHILKAYVEEIKSAQERINEYGRLTFEMTQSLFAK